MLQRGKMMTTVATTTYELNSQMFSFKYKAYIIIGGKKVGGFGYK